MCSDEWQASRFSCYNGVIYDNEKQKPQSDIIILW